jgi:hypothetical protein
VGLLVVAVRPSVQVPADSECLEADQAHEPAERADGISTAIARAKARIKTH